MNILIYIIYLLFQVYTIMLFVRILLSWLPQLYEYRLVQFIVFYTDPYLNIFRRFIPPLGMIDISPIAAFFCLGLIQNITLEILRRLAG